MTTPDLPPVLLSTASVYPESTVSGFELAATLGYDGVELMVGIDPVAADIDAVEKLADHHGVRVGAVHAPVLLITQNTWGSDPWEKLHRSAEAATRLGASTVVVHPPFRWQRDYASGFVDGIRRLTESTGIVFAVENMYPWRTPAGNFQAYLPDWDPTDVPYDHLTLDLSHASTARKHSLDYVHAWGDRLAHVHLTDGSGSLKDEHLFPGEGDQQAWDVVQELARTGFDGQIALEVNSRKAGSRGERETMLAQCLQTIRTQLRRGAESRALR
ncbi:MAG: sugar phosphate isomerase/epimerase family protein [Propionibacteriaceae bacterium]|nr:sugar phosphate isomerase/epimerase family protein [Propionibacteriaceae bacterium]